MPGAQVVEPEDKIRLLEKTLVPFEPESPAMIVFTTGVGHFNGNWYVHNTTLKRRE